MGKKATFRLEDYLISQIAHEKSYSETALKFLPIQTLGSIWRFCKLDHSVFPNRDLNYMSLQQYWKRGSSESLRGIAA